jgi:hypothetical protein
MKGSGVDEESGQEPTTCKGRIIKIEMGHFPNQL